MTVDRAEVAVAVYQRDAQGEILRETHERVVNRGVAVRMLAFEHRADGGRGFAVLLVGG